MCWINERREVTKQVAMSNEVNVFFDVVSFSVIILVKNFLILIAADVKKQQQNLLMKKNSILHPNICPPVPQGVARSRASCYYDSISIIV